MTKPFFLCQWILFSVVFSSPVKSSGASISRDKNLRVSYLIEKPAPKKFSVVKSFLYKVSLGLMKRKKSSNAGLIIAAILAGLLVAFVAFSAAYAGAAGGVPALILVVGLGLIVFGAIKLSRKRKRS